jgi:D-apionolactonase
MSFPIVYDGSGQAPPQTIALRAGNLSMLYEEGTLRYVRVGEHEILRQIYCAVRDQNWGTITPQLSDAVMDIHAEHFNITYTSTHQNADIHFVWRGSIVGDANGVTFSMDGEALSTFKRNRIGFCVLHPMSVAGNECTIEHVDGTSTHGHFPTHIAPHQPYFNIRAITHTVTDGISAIVRMEGDTFEMEDQRNWIDASYKTYCTPLGLPFPHTIEKGTKIQQKIHVGVNGDIITNVTEMPVMVTLGERLVPLQQLGFVLNADFDMAQIALLKPTQPHFLRVYITPSQDDVFAKLAHAHDVAQAIDCQLELAIWLSQDAPAELENLKNALSSYRGRVARIFVFRRGEKVTSASTMQLARDSFGELGVMLGGGTDAFFTELNRERPDLSVLDAVNYSLNPQVHAFDNASLIETTTVIATTLESARAFCGDKPLSVAPITLKMRWNPNATAPEPARNLHELPRQVDVRQASLIGAGWTLGAINALAQAGAQTATFYQITGMLGIMLPEDDAHIRALFPAPLGAVYPMWHVFADVNTWRGASYRHIYSNDPLRVACFAVQHNSTLRVILANLQGVAQTIVLNGVTGEFSARTLDANTAHNAMTQPHGFRQNEGESMTLIGADHITLSPYALMTLTKKS